MTDLTASTWRHPDKIRPAAWPGALKLGRALDPIMRRERPLAVPPVGSGLKPVMGMKGWPLAGKTFDIIFSGPEYSQRVYERYGPVSWANTFGLKIVLALGPDALQAILVNADKAYSQTGWEYFIGPFFRRGLMLLDFDEHLLHRRIMQEAFTRPRLAGYLERTDEFVAKDVAAWPSEGQIFAYPTLKRLSLDIATAIFMGDRTGDDDARLQTAFIDTVRAGTSLIRADVPGMRWRRGLEGRKVLEDYFRTKLPAKRAADTDDLFSALCHVETETGETFSDDDVVNHMIFLMMAAHDTTTITTSAVLAALAANPEWQERAREQSLAMDG
ncbi:MAG TPA: cytochrome P450, partial [Mycobacteriales bacterium]|nr:cytochrome P450 [Mycobacteriales bacterium]